MSLAQLLLNEGTHVNGSSPAKRRWSPLSTSIIHGQVKIVQLLLEQGADVNQSRGLHSGTPLQAAMLYRSEALVRALLERGADVHFEGWYRLELKVGSRVDDAIVRLLLCSSD